MHAMRTLSRVISIMALSSACSSDRQDLYDRVEHHYADSDGVRIHYVTVGQGPLVVMIHGFPDYWYSWRHQMEALSKDHRVAAMDMRGYNRSDKPKGVESYGMAHLIDDLAAVVRD
ncbi:MAG: alpha/beta fold hydrolase, partial [Gemmatimonadales bacterium]